ncbi:hypothetical protein ACFW04_011344 [Cataglyphis niger]
MSRASSFSILQANHNYFYQANDLFAQSLVEGGCGLGIVADPVRIPPDDICWAGDSMVAIIREPATGSRPIIPRTRGEDLIAVDSGPTSVVGVYLPPSLNRGVRPVD